MKLIDKLLQLGVEGIPKKEYCGTNTRENPCQHCNGANSMHDQWANIEISDSLHPMVKPHSCKCRNDNGGAMTVRRLDEGLFQCPRCGGIIVPTVKVPSEQELSMFIRAIIRKNSKSSSFWKDIHGVLGQAIRNHMINNGDEK